MAWVTTGRTIENYLPGEALSSLYGNDNLPVLGRYEGFAQYLDKVIDGEEKKFLRNKVFFARRVLPHITKEGMEKTLDLMAFASEAGKRIYSWNGRSRCALNADRKLWCATHLHQPLTIALHLAIVS